MILSELKEELEAQGLPIDGTRNLLYQRLHKARRINCSTGMPLWVPKVEEEEEEGNVIPGEVIELVVLRYYENSCHSSQAIFLYFFRFMKSLLS